MKRFFVLFAALMLLCFNQCIGSQPVRGNGVAASKTLSISDFSSISVIGSLDVEYFPTGGAPSATLYADQNLLDVYDIKVVGNELIIGSVPGKNPMPRAKCVLALSGPVASRITVTGSAEVDVKAPVRVPGNVGFSITGSGDIEASMVECAAFSANVTGSGDIDIDALTSEKATLAVSGSGDIDIVCRGAGDITASIAGSGDIELSGSARSLNSSRTGSGRVKSTGLLLGQ